MSCLFFGILLFVVGCTSNSSEPSPRDENITTIKTVLKQQFLAPDKQLLELFNSPGNQSIIGEGVKESIPESPTKLELYLEKKYKSHFTENMYNEFIGAYALGYQLTATNNGYQMQVDSIDIEQNENSYSFTANVQYKKDDNESKVAKVSGTAHINEQGEISDIKFFEDDGLSEALKAVN